MANIKITGQIGGGLILASMAVAAAFASVEINQIRFGGPIQSANQQVGDLVADILPPPEYIIEPYLEATLLLNGQGSVAQHKARLAELHRQYDERYDYWRSSDLDPRLKTMLVSDSASSAKLFWRELETNVIPAAEHGDTARLRTSYDRLTALYTDHRRKIDALVKASSDFQTKLAADSQAALQRTVIWLIGAALIVGALMVADLIFIIRRALNPLGAMAEAMENLAAGDTTATVPGQGRDDEIGVMASAFEVFRTARETACANELKQQTVVTELADALEALAAGDMTYRITTPFADQYEDLRTAFNSSVETLGQMMTSVAETAASVHSGASEIHVASDDLAVRTEKQAAHLEETAAAMNQVTGMVKTTAKGAADVDALIAQAHREATDGGAVVRNAVDAMGAIQASAKEIAQIVNLIDGIAFQTNLLALNAGVEAARAGDAGKGFAVVANEVRALAQRSADAAKDIKELIATSADHVAGGVALVGETGAVLDSIVARVGEISGLVSAIASNAEIQATNLQQINGAVGDMDRMTQQNAAMVEESTAAASSLADEATALSALVAGFTLRQNPPRREIMPLRLAASA